MHILYILYIFYCRWLLQVDNADGHNISLDLKNKLTNVELHFMPPNTTSVLQPCDQGIIKTFKLYYSKILVKYLLELSENEKEFTPLTASQAIININKAWRQVSQSTIVNCWRKADILDNKSIDYSIDLNNFELDIFFTEEIRKATVDYVKALEKYRKDYVELEEVDHLDYDFEKYLNCDNDVQTSIDMTNKSYKF
jgi:hypothetical protein